MRIGAFFIFTASQIVGLLRGISNFRLDNEQPKAMFWVFVKVFFEFNVHQTVGN